MLIFFFLETCTVLFLRILKGRENGTMVVPGHLSTRRRGETVLFCHPRSRDQEGRDPVVSDRPIEPMLFCHVRLLRKSYPSIVVPSLPSSDGWWVNVTSSHLVTM